MVANINSMAYTGETPWHGLGKKVDHVMTSAEAIDAAGLNWTVEKCPLYLKNTTVPVAGAFANVRSDNEAVLGIVGDQYTVLQNAQGFSIADAIVGEKAAMYHTAGALGQGERVWMLLQMPGLIRTIGDDVTEKYLLVGNGHDGSFALHVLFTPIRVVCQNTLNAALAGAVNKVVIRHTSSMNDRVNVDEIRKALGVAYKHFDLFEKLSQKLVSVPFKSSDLKEYAQVTGLIPREKDEKELSTRAQNIMDEVSALFETGKGTEIKGVKGTAWAAYNAVVEYVDYKRGADADRRADSLLYGSGAKIKQVAFNRALEIAGVKS